MRFPVLVVIEEEPVAGADSPPLFLITWILLINVQFYYHAHSTRFAKLSIFLVRPLYVPLNGQGCRLQLNADIVWDVLHEIKFVGNRFTYIQEQLTYP